MNREMIILAVAYSICVSGKITDNQRKLLEENNIDFKTLNEYVNKIRDNKLTIEEQDNLEKLFNIDLSVFNNTNNSNNTNNNSKSNNKVYTLSNGNKRYGVDDAAFSDIYMFGFLVLLFQVFFLVVSYMIFNK